MCVYIYIYIYIYIYHGRKAGLARRPRRDRSARRKYDNNKDNNDNNSNNTDNNNENNNSDNNDNDNDNDNNVSNNNDEYTHNLQCGGAAERVQRRGACGTAYCTILYYTIT